MPDDLTLDGLLDLAAAVPLPLELDVEQYGDVELDPDWKDFVIVSPSADLELARCDSEEAHARYLVAAANELPRLARWVKVLIEAWHAACEVLEWAERFAERTPCHYCGATPDEDGDVDHDDDCVGGWAHVVLMQHTLRVSDAARAALAGTDAADGEDIHAQG